MSRAARTATMLGMRASCAALFLLAACSPGEQAADAAPVDDSSTGGLTVAEPTPPDLGACPEGWRRLTEDGADRCDPWPEGGAATCGIAEYHLPGTEGCQPVGTPCPAGDFPETLPADAPIVYVRQGSIGGDGSSPTSALATVAAAMAGLARGSVVAIGAGTYDESFTVYSGITLQGVCAARTVLTASTTAGSEGVVNVAGIDVVLRDLSIRDAERVSVWVEGRDPSVDLDGVAIEGGRFVSLLAADGSVAGRNILVRGTRPRQPDLLFGRAVTAEGNATRVELHQSVLENNIDVAASLATPGIVGVFEDVAVLGVEPRATDRDYGSAIHADDGAAVEVRRAVIERCHGVALASTDEGSSLAADQVVVRDVRPYQNDLVGGFGVFALHGASAEIRRSLLDETSEAAVGAQAASLTIEDVVISDVRGQPAGFGRGLSVQDRVTLVARRILVVRAGEVGVHAREPGSTLDGEDLRIIDTLGRAVDGRGGRGLDLEAGATGHVARLLVERSREVGVVATGADTMLSVEDASVVEFSPGACAEPSCAADSYASGLGAFASGHLVASRFVVAAAHLCGVHVATLGEMDLRMGEVRMTAIGACVQIADYDIGRLTDDVAYLDNDVNLDTTELPVPEPLAPTST